MSKKQKTGQLVGVALVHSSGAPLRLDAKDLMVLAASAGVVNFIVKEGVRVGLPKPAREVSESLKFVNKFFKSIIKQKPFAFGSVGIISMLAIASSAKALMETPNFPTEMLEAQGVTLPDIITLRSKLNEALDSSDDTRIQAVQA